MLERLKSPWLLLGLSGLVYKALQQYVSGFAISNEDWQLIVDLVTYLFIGVGVYSGHQSAIKDENNGEDI